MKTILSFCILLISIAGFSQVEFNSPITLNNITFQHEFIDRIITVTEEQIIIATSVDSLTTDIQKLNIRDYSLSIGYNSVNHIYKCSSLDNLYPTTFVFHKVMNEVTHITVFQPTLNSESIQEFDFLID